MQDHRIRKFWRSAAPSLFGASALAPVTFICFRLQVGLATVALVYLMVVVLLSLKGSFISSAMVSVLAVGCLDYFFTAPMFTFAMNDLPSYMAIIVFMIVSLIITSLVSKVRKQAEDALSSVSHKVIEAEEQERQRIASDLHENLGQRLTLLALEVEQLQRGSRKLEAPGGIELVHEKILEILKDVKSLAHELYSPRLEYLGIDAVMRSYCRDFGEQKRVEISFRSDGLPTLLPPDISLCLLRVLQEALRNAVMHSGQRQFDVQLAETADQIHLTVSDSGSGFDLEKARKSGALGVNRMRERLKLVKGSLSIESQTKLGTKLRARVPLHAENVP